VTLGDDDWIVVRPKLLFVWFARLIVLSISILIAHAVDVARPPARTGTPLLLTASAALAQLLLNHLQPFSESAI